MESLTQSQLEEKLEKLELLMRIGTALSAERSKDRLIEMILLEAKALCNADGGTLYLRSEDTLRFAILPMVFSGLGMLGIELARTWAFLLQVRGALTVVKFALITLGAVFPDQRFGWYLAASVLAVLGAHLPEQVKTWQFWTPTDLQPERAESVTL